jgi:hypothetical protein
VHPDGTICPPTEVSALASSDMDTRIILHRPGGTDDQVVDHPEQPADYFHADGSRWTWLERWRLVGGTPYGPGTIGATHVRVYDPVK